MSKSKDTRSNAIRIIIGLVVILVIGFILQFTNVVNFLNTAKPKVSITPAPIHKLSTPSNPTVKLPSKSNGISQGTSSNISNPSTVPATTPSSSWITSTSGLLTVKQPTSNATVQSGFSLVGTSNESNVQYTLIDNSAGMISQGKINVVNGDFAAKISFKSYGPTGRLDVYNTDPNGKEINLVEIPLSF